MTIDKNQYQESYKRSISEPDAFWAEQAEKFISWTTKWHTVKRGDFTDLDISWFVGGKLNASYNCLDRHLEKRKNQTAIIWQGDQPDTEKRLTYGELYTEVCRFADVLKKLGVKKGDRVCIYLPMIPEVAIAMLACARIGAIHSVVFAGFSPDSLKSRILDADAKLVITSDEGMRGGKIVPIKQNVDKALASCPHVASVVVVKRTGNDVPFDANRDKWYHELMLASDSLCVPEVMDADDPLFTLYTSGSTGKPKGVLHTTGGYMVYAAMTFQYIFDYRDGDIYWCTADVGWVTGHTYVVYGPLACGATIVMYEGTPNYPTFSRFWQIVDKYQVSIFYTAPTAIRALRREGDKWVTDTKRTSLRLLGTVGEPINPDVWQWYYDVVGDKRCDIVDTWWQTETGGILISPLPGATPLKAGSASWPFFGIVPAVVDDAGNEVLPNVGGRLVIKQPWPGLMKTIYNDHQRFINNYFKEVPGCYLTGDGAHYDIEGYYWIAGRNDDVIKISGHRIGTEEVESAFLSHHAVSEAAVVGVPDEIKGQHIYAFVSTLQGVEQSDKLKQELIQHVRTVIGAIATPEEIQWVKDLPKTRSGKIMRRILRKIACDEEEALGDISTLADPGVVNDIIAGHQKLHHS